MTHKLFWIQICFLSPIFYDGNIRLRFLGIATYSMTFRLLRKYMNVNSHEYSPDELTYDRMTGDTVR